MPAVTIILWLLGVGVAIASAPAMAQNGTSKSTNPQCPVLPTFIARLATSVPDLGGGKIFDETATPVEQIGSLQCPPRSATQCERLAYLSLMFGLLDMSPQVFRRPGLAAFLANVESEDASFGSKCSVEDWGYKGDNIRLKFPGLSSRFCSAGAPGYATAKQAGIILTEGQCDTTDAGLTKLKVQIKAENPGLVTRPGYDLGFAPIVARLYTYRFKAASDEESFLFRGRGFIQITGKSNYQACQNDVASAAKYLASSPVTERIIRSVTGLDWGALDVVRTPDAVSQNQYVAAFCAASYWKDNSAKPELIWADDSKAFASIVSSINPVAAAANTVLRRPAFTRWCAVIVCASNYPKELDFASGFGTLARLAQAGAAIR